MQLLILYLLFLLQFVHCLQVSLPSQSMKNYQIIEEDAVSTCQVMQAHIPTLIAMMTLITIPEKIKTVHTLLLLFC